MITLSVLVSGRVQGVGFRAFVVRDAIALGVRGEVWNRPDGGVELIAQHEDRAQLDELVQRLRAGPGRVASVTADEVPEAGAYDAFGIGHFR
ncbi:MAG: acylphosphatase [Armatimonadetes bacterium]|nr:acylphosphatase [Armatimonadota bacterium]